MNEIRTELRGVVSSKRVLHIWQYFTLQKGLDATLFQQRYLLGIAQIAVRLVLRARRSRRRDIVTREPSVKRVSLGLSYRGW